MSWFHGVLLAGTNVWLLVDDRRKVYSFQSLAVPGTVRRPFAHERGWPLRIDPPFVTTDLASVFLRTIISTAVPPFWLHALSVLGISKLRSSHVGVLRTWADEIFPVGRSIVARTTIPLGRDHRYRSIAVATR